MRNFTLISFFMLSPVLLSGCFGGNSAPIPADHYYRLDNTAPHNPANRPTLSGSLAVQQIIARGLYQERAVLFIRPDTPLELHRHHYHHWVDSPSRLIQEDLLHYLYNAGFAEHAERFQPGKPADHSIGGRIKRFERVLGSDGVTVTVSLQLEYRSVRTETLLHKEYTQSVPAPDRKMYSSIAAFDAALQQIYEQFTADIRRELSRAQR
jgi:ABC-type uncharacterized transport system auxiliary subunit